MFGCGQCLTFEEAADVINTLDVEDESDSEEEGDEEE